MEAQCQDGPTQGGVSPRPGKLDSQAGATGSGSRCGGAGEDASVRGARRNSGGSNAGGLSNDEARSEGENGESGEAEHGTDCRGEADWEVRIRATSVNAGRPSAGWWGV